MSTTVTRAATLALLLAVTACAGDDDSDPTAAGTAPVVQLGAPGETSRVLTGDAAAATLPPATPDDVAFAHGMVAHHQQGLDLAALVADRADRADLPLFAERITVSQTDEIAQLENWLTEQGEEVTIDGDHLQHGELMPGMLTEEQVAALAATTGVQFDQAFLEAMIVHHEGAVVMVEQLLSSETGGQEPTIFQLAQHMSSDQQVEIARMKSLLAEL